MAMKKMLTILYYIFVFSYILFLSRNLLVKTTLDVQIANMFKIDRNATKNKQNMLLA